VSSDAQLFSRAETFRFLMVGVVLTPSVGMAWKLIAWRQLSVKSAIYGKLTGLFVSGSVDIRLILSYGHFCSYVHTAPLRTAPTNGGPTVRAILKG
jgi:hypothetical protein